MNLVEGKLIASQISATVKKTVNELGEAPRITVITCNPNFETKKFLALKKTKAETLGILMKTVFAPEESTTKDMVDLVVEETKQTDGLVVQLPLPSIIDADKVLDAIPKNLDVDVFSYQGEDTDILPPVVGAIDEITKHYQVDWFNKKVAIFGSGRLVGAPALFYAHSKKVNRVHVITENSNEVEKITSQADIIISGVGKPGILTANMVKDGVVIFDAGSSEDNGFLAGDVQGQVLKAQLLTPVPGGIGPITVALLFRNLLKLSLRQ